VRLRAGGHRQLVAAGGEGDLVERVGQLGFQAVEVAGDGEGVLAVHAVIDAEPAQDVFGVLVEVAIDLQRVAIDRDRGDRLPHVVDRRPVVFAASEDHQVGQHFRAGRAAVRPGRQPDRADEIRQGVHLASRAGVLRVHRVVRGQHRHESTRSGQPEGLEDEVVVHALAGAVVHRVVQDHMREGHVPDHGIEILLGQTRVGERLGPDRRIRVQAAADRGRQWVEFHAGQLGTLRGQADERAGTGAGLQHRTAGEAERRHRPPHLPGDQRIGVVGVEGRASRRIPFRVGQQAAQVAALTPPIDLGGVEHVGDRTPTRPAGQHPLLIGGGRTALVGEHPDQPDRSHVRLEPGLRPGRGKVVLESGDEPRRRPGGG